MTRLAWPVLLVASLTVGCDDGRPLEGKAPADLAVVVPVNCALHPELCGCQDDGACSGSMPKCDRLHGWCVACLPPADGCLPGQTCRTTGVGAYECAGDPSECSDNADCKAAGPTRLCCSGRCIDAGTDPKNCGSCGFVCPPPVNGVPACAQGNCVLGCCHAGFDDCDHNPVNCCETDISNDPSNCGACGRVCKPIANALPTCHQGRCQPLCAPGFANCNDNNDDGCEVDLSTDPLHCGNCATACTANQKCVGSRCQ